MISLKSRLPLLILALGALLRAATLGSAALWYDESVTLYRTTIPFMTLYTNQTDNSGCLLLDLLLRPLMAISHSLWLLRLPSLLASLLSLYLVWLLMRSLRFTLPQQLFAAAFVAFLPGLLWVAQDARTYSLLGLVFLAALYFAVEGRLLGLAACLGLLGYSHSVGPAYAAAAFCAALYLTPGRARRIFMAGGLAALAWLPALAHIKLMSMTVFGVMQPWAPHLTWSWFVNELLIALFVNRSVWLRLLACLVLLASVGLFYTQAWKCRARNVLLIGVLVPLLVMYLVGLVWNNVIIYRTLIPLMYALMLWLGWEFGSKATLMSPYRWIIAALWTCLLVTGLTLWRPADRGGHLDQAAAGIRSQWRTGDLLVYESKTTYLPFQYYLGDLPQYFWPEIKSTMVNEPGVTTYNTGDPAQARRVWLVLTEDALITPTERELLHAVFPHGPPLWRILYVQASTIDVYLVER